jgi:23S rRNA pseudouridine2605 synthase
MKDEEGRACIGDVCAKLNGNPRPVGRLDRASEGVLLLTSDGELANRLTHPRYGVRKEYQATVEPRLRDADARAMVDSVALEDGPARFDGMVLDEHDGDRSRVTVSVSEGRNRLIRRVFEALGYEVRRLKRVRFGPITLGKLELNHTRQLTDDEVMQLKRVAGMLERKPPRVERTGAAGAAESTPGGDPTAKLRRRR